ncbi:MAG: hypothetical protein PHT33_09150 [bacterium]|nr:hypothetical protein [bacterium]
MTSYKYKIASVISHPIQYNSPIFRGVAAHHRFDLTVFFASDHGVSSRLDPEFGKAFAWDVPLLEGYRHILLKNSSQGMDINDWRLDGPELKGYYHREKFDAVLVNGWDKKLYWQAIFWAKRMGIPVIMRGDSNLKQNRPW